METHGVVMSWCIIGIYFVYLQKSGLSAGFAESLVNEWFV